MPPPSFAIADKSSRWPSDYIPRSMDGLAQNAPAKPKMDLAGQDGNIFAILGRASHLLKQAGLREQSREMNKRVTASKSYDEALSIISEYVQTELSAPPRAGQEKENDDLDMTDKQKLEQRLNQSMDSFKAEWMKLSPETLIGKAGEITAVQDAYRFLTSEYSPEPDEAALLLQCDDPLQHIAGWVEGHMGNADDLYIAYDDAIDDLREELERKSKPAEKTSALEKLRDKQMEAGSPTTSRSAAPLNKEVR